MTSTLKRILICLLPLAALAGHADEFEWSDIGLRIGIDAENRVDVKSYELITTLISPWSWSPNAHFAIDLGVVLGLGALAGEGETGLLAHAGPSIEVAWGERPITLVISSGPALLSEHEFDNLDLGGTLQFMSAVGFDYKMTVDWTLGYRYLHISNAGLHDKNPGMNLHAVNLYRKF